MPADRLFAKLGVLVVPDFLTSTESDRLASAVEAAPLTEASVRLRDRAEEVVDGGRRRTGRAEVAPEVSGFVVDRLLALRPTVEQFFALRLAGVLEPPKFLVYRPGDFFIPHRDMLETGTPVIAARRVNLVVSLNDPAASPDGPGYLGGALTLYGLIDEPRWKRYGLPVPGTRGALVAFRSDVLHEVTAVVRGERLSIVSRMLDPGAEGTIATSPG